MNLSKKLFFLLLRPLVFNSVFDSSANLWRNVRVTAFIMVGNRPYSGLAKFGWYRKLFP